MDSVRNTWIGLSRELGAENYFDNAATTPLDPRVAKEMHPWLAEDFGNAHSLHARGRKAAHAVELARMRIAELVDSPDPGEIIFTSGATEANNWVLSQFSSVAASPFEHSSVREPLLAGGGVEAEAEGWRLLPPGKRFDLLAAMLVNNETGAFVQIEDWHRSSPESQGVGAAHVHRDLTQAAGKFMLHDHAYDFGSLSAHKLHGPKGVGALHMRGSILEAPLIRGGGQESGLRGGTLNVPAIVGFGAAAALSLDEMGAANAHVTELRGIVQEEIATISDQLVHENAAAQSPAILAVSFAGLEGETLVIEADARGYAISSGAACSSHSTEPSHVLMALGVDERLVRGTVRISFSKFNSRESASGLGKALAEAVDRLRTY